MPNHGDVDNLGRMWCSIHNAWVDVQDRHLDGAFAFTPGMRMTGRPPLLREIPHELEQEGWASEADPDEDPCG